MTKLASAQQLSEPTQQVLTRTLEIITGKWRLQIIFRLAEQKLRFSDLSHSILGVSDKVLVSELKKLVALGFLQKESFQEKPPRVEYELTEKARKIMPILHRLTHAVEMVLSS